MTHDFMKDIWMLSSLYENILFFQQLGQSISDQGWSWCKLPNVRNSFQETLELLDHGMPLHG